ncbi:MAG: T9SS type A sorting domain-containing protein [Bacteroidota bacterium]
MKEVLCFLSLVVVCSIQAQAVVEVRFTQVDYNAETVTLKNFGAMEQDVSGFWLCLGPGMYNSVGNYTGITGDFVLSPDEEVTIDVTSGTQNVPALPDANGGLGLFLDNSDFNSNSAAQLLDYIQWGASNQNRVSQAVNAGRWDDAANFVAGQAPYNFIGENNDTGPALWIDDTAIRLVEIVPEMDEVVIKNFDSVERDISGYFFCTLAGIYPAFGNSSEVEVVSGDLMLSPDEEVRVRVLSTGGVVDVDGSIFLFSSAALGFNNQNAFVTRDFAQWGAPNGFRVENATATNRWDSDTSFIDGASPFNYIGGADDVGAAFWDVTTSTSNNLADIGTLLEVFPNPTRNLQVQLRIENAEIGQVDVRIMDTAGREIQHLSVSNQSTEFTTDLDVSGLARGVYFVQAVINGRMGSERLVVLD